MSYVGLLVMLALTFVGVPLFLAIFVGCIIILVIDVGIAPVSPIQTMFIRLTSPDLIAVPLFILMGHILAVGGASKPLVGLMNSFMGHIPGGPAYALIVANILLAAMCASPIAGIAAFGPVMIPLMVGLGYSERFAIGLVICSSVLAPLIPPSILPIFYAYIAGAYAEGAVSVTTLWTASIIPGIMTAVLLAITVYIYSRRGHFQRLPAATWADRWQALKEGWAVLLMPAVILVPLYMNKATPQETAAIGMFYVILISVFIYRGLKLRGFWEACVQTAQVLGMVFCIVAGALLLTSALSYSRIPFEFADKVTDMGMPWYGFMMANLVLFILLGMFMDPAAIVLICVPLLLTPILDLGIDVYAYGVFTTIAVNVGMLTPPYGFLLFATVGILNKPYMFIVKSCLMFMPALVIGMVMVAFWQGLSTWLPEITGK